MSSQQQRFLHIVEQSAPYRATNVAGVSSEHFRAKRMKCHYGDLKGFPPYQVKETVFHLASCLLRKGKRQHFRRASLAGLDEMRYPACDNLRLTRTCPGNYQQRTLIMGNSGQLLRVQALEYIHKLILPSGCMAFNRECYNKHKRCMSCLS
jgi:hypothetical protein